MNAGLPDTHPSIAYYDSDYPGREITPIAENFDETTVLQGLAWDVERYRELAAEYGGPVLEMCCGTGRVAIPLARSGFEVAGVDLSAPMLERFQDNLQREEEIVRTRVCVRRHDVTSLDFDRRDFGVATFAFNSLLCILEPQSQIAALRAAAAHVKKGGAMVVDVVNPMILPLAGDPVPKPFLNRRNVHNGASYTRFAALGPFDVTQRQRLYGWYDEMTAGGLVKRTQYSMHWRPIFRSELELMFQLAGLELCSIEGGHRHEPFTATSPKIFAVARRTS